MVLQQILASRMKRVMISEHLTVPGIAEKAGIAISSAQGYLHARGNPRADTIELVFQNLGCSLADMLNPSQSVPDEPPDVQSLAGKMQTIHPLLRPVVYRSFQMAKDMVLLSEALYKWDGSRNGGAE